ncbi:MAG: cell division protein FtsZ [Candidatus Omnitrophica bacterium]|nr:cell division protein FtsZ [Candidatus Omnitrophota bacterium]MCM8806969.1 cell division protein FtsZ [Candidatus Omnitrophota bacterium]
MVKPIIEEPVKFSDINIKVVGVGNCGGKIVSRIYEQKINGVQFIAVSTNARALENTKADIKILIGEKTIQGIGTGGDPEKGRIAANEDKEKISEVLKNTKILFLIAGLGKGTGTGGAPVIAKIAKDLGALTISLVTTPFELEGEKSLNLAKEGLNNLLKNVDTLIHISNQKLFEIVDENIPAIEAFSKIDEIILRTITSITDLIYKEKLLGISFADIRSVVENAGKGIVGIGYGKGEGRMEKAVREAIDNPLVEKSEIMQAKNILISITGSPDLTWKEIWDAIHIIQSRISSPSRHLGIATDKNLNDEVKITLLATGIEEKPTTEKEKPILVSPKREEKLFGKTEMEENIDEPAWLRKSKEVL